MADPQQFETPCAPKLVISYSHDSPEHEDRVRELADRLRAGGVDAWIDQYSPAPPEGWPMWMGDRIKNSDFVLLVCTETYLRRVEAREEPGKGRGVSWEAKLIFNLMYVADAKVQKFIPVLFADCQPSFVPLPLQGLERYQVDTDAGYKDLYRHLTKQPRHQAPALGERKLLALPPQAAISYAASLSARPATKPNTFEQRSRHAVIKRVRHDWIEGVLDQSLYKVAPLELGLSEEPELVEQPLNAVIQVPDREPRPITGIPISQVFDEHNNTLLILGAPALSQFTMRRQPDAG